MKESLFKSGLAGPPLNAPPFFFFLPYNCTHALPISHARTCKHVKACSLKKKKQHTCRVNCKFSVFDSCSLGSLAKMSSPVCSGMAFVQCRVSQKMMYNLRSNYSKNYKA